MTRSHGKKRGGRIVSISTEQGMSGQQRLRPFTISALAIFGGLLTVMLSVVAPLHGPWFDEFWTRFFSDPAPSLKSAFFDRWVNDVHPPLFSLLAYLTAHVARLPIEQARLLNLIPMAAAAIFAMLVARRHPSERTFLAVALVSIAASPYYVAYFAEYRSYFTGICAFACLTISLVVIDRAASRGEQAGAFLWAGFGVSLAICLNIHYLTTAMTVILVAVFGLGAAMRGDWKRFVIYLVAGVILIMPFIGFIVFQWATIERISADYWLKTDLLAAAGMLLDAVVAPTCRAQTAVILAWGAAALLYLRHGNRPRLDGAIGLLLIAIAAEVAMLLVYTGITAALTDRYLMPLSILASAVFAIVLSAEIMASRALLTLFLLTNFGAAIYTASPLTKDMRWDEAAHYLAERQKACPGARIVPMQQDPNDHTPNTIQNYNEAYGYMARKWGLVLGPVDTPSSRPRVADCPDYYWADHFFASGKNRETLLTQFASRFPALKGCAVDVAAFRSLGVVFTVTGDPPQCHR